MITDELSSLTQIDDKQRAVLEDKLGIASCYDLILVERAEIVRAFGRRANRPDMQTVAEWQDEARRVRAAAIAAAEWDQVGMFVVVFEQRHRDAETERRIVAEQTEVDPEATREWPDWACAEACQWMLERIAGPLEELATPGGGKVESAEEPEPTRGRTARLSHLRIENVVLRHPLSDDDTRLVIDGHVASTTPGIWAQSAQLVVDLGGAPKDPGTSIMLNLDQPGGPSASIEGRIRPPGRVAEIVVEGVPAGTYTPSILAMRSDGSALPSIVKLPKIDLLGSWQGPTT